MDRMVVIANPAASQFTGGAHRDVMSIFDDVAKVEAVWPESANQVSERARRAAASGADIVVAMGGDGMVHHVAQGLVGTETALGIIPVGTTNVVARLLKIPGKEQKAARLIAARPDPELFGVAQMTLTRGTTETVHYALFACGFGLDAAVVVKADKDPYRKYRFGSIHYLNTALGVALTDFPRRKPNVTVVIAGASSMVTAAVIQFRSVYTYFGKIPLRLAPETPDPMIALTLGRLPRHRIPRIAATIFTGRDLSGIKDIEVHSGVTRLEAVADPPVAAQADGESLGMVDNGVVEWRPDSLRVISPQLSRR